MPYFVGDMLGRLQDKNVRVSLDFFFKLLETLADACLTGCPV